MDKIGIFFGTDTGTTRLMAKKMAKKLGPDLADKPLNVNRTETGTLMGYDALIVGTPTYGIDQLPGMSTGIKAGSWEEFLPQLAGQEAAGGPAFPGSRCPLPGTRGEGPSRHPGGARAGAGGPPVP